MQNMQLFDDVAPLISRFLPDSGLSMQRYAPPAAIWSRVSCTSWWALAGLFAGLFAADSHAEAQQTGKAIAAPAHQAGVVLEASGSTFIRPFPRGDADLQTS